MKTWRTALATAVTALSLGVPVAAGTPDGYQPQLKPAQPSDAPSRNNASEAPAATATGDDANTMSKPSAAAAHPDSRSVRPGTNGSEPPIGNDGRDWITGGMGVLLGAVLAVLALTGASAIRDRRRIAVS